MTTKTLKKREETVMCRKSKLADSYRSDAGVTLVILDFEPLTVDAETGKRMHERRFALSTPNGVTSGIVSTTFDMAGK